MYIPDWKEYEKALYMVGELTADESIEKEDWELPHLEKYKEYLRLYPV